MDKFLPDVGYYTCILRIGKVYPALSLSPYRNAQHRLGKLMVLGIRTDGYLVLVFRILAYKVLYYFIHLVKGYSPIGGTPHNVTSFRRLKNLTFKLYSQSKKDANARLAITPMVARPLERA